MELLDWESVESHIRIITMRTKIFGGWLVKSYENVGYTTLNSTDTKLKDSDWRISLTFVPDPNHEWNLDETKEDSK